MLSDVSQSAHNMPRVPPPLDCLGLTVLTCWNSQEEKAYIKKHVAEPNNELDAW